MPLYLTEADVDVLGDMELALEAVEGAFDRQGRGVAGNVGRRRATVPAGSLNVMGGADQELGAAGAKIYGSFGGGARFVVVLFDVATGLLRAVIEAGRLGELRTGAASGISCKYLARPDSRVVGLIGSGRQARTQLEALNGVHELTAARVYSRNPENVENYVKTMRERVNAELVACTSAAEAVRGADIVVTATSAAGPVLLADDLEPGMHVVAMGSNNPVHGEVDAAAVARVDRVFVDDLDGAHVEGGDL
ncbi:MAG: ornithine cyclodeaminase family protein, partial [Chloroflexota bacterium]|nr:ornithine cyclodeaminase family protein [Chloroflexota bacterium]